MNRTASVNRNFTGAYTTAQKRVDWILSSGPFNPQKSQIPQEIVKTCTGAGDLYCGCNSQTNATLKLAPTNSTTPATYTECVAIYNDPPLLNGLLQFLTPSAPPTFGGKMTTTIADVSQTPGAPPYFYRATVRVDYQFAGKAYSYTMNTVRAADR